MGPLESKSDDMRRMAIGAVTALIGVAAVLYVIFGGEPAPDTISPDSATQQTDTNQKAEAANEVVPEFDLVRISRGGTGVIAGRMTPGARVELYANGKKISEVVANDDGEWVMILQEPLEAGSVELNLKAVDKNHNRIAEADNVVVVSVPERDDKRFVEREQNGVVAVLTPKSGDGASTVLQKPGVAAFGEVGESLSVDTIDYGDGGAAVFTGRSLPRVDVRLYLDDEFIGSVRATDSGRWSIPLKDRMLTAGNHLIRVDQTIGDGQVQLRIEQPFRTGSPIDPQAAEGGVFVKPGNTLWQIARQLYGSGVRYTVIFKENSEQIRDPDLIYPGQIFRLPNKAATNGAEG
ncbi:LysM peptidoglycan-binding domain-containing protein [Kordiimonas aestuarii]|uniref:LysM peptidoglycan-binding domain-containing protein n=1 Tax=Kordiimonas aestuarii TaxID=1005925 RepID=UPI0021D3DF55|nr:LysM peptidoglycan-binding domain-containing protein [Kordiimonas aestuarii]